MIPWATNIGNAYLEAVTSEKVCFRAGPEFSVLEGHLFIIYRTLYGLRFSRKLFGQLLQECLRELRFEPSFAESTIYMGKCPTADHYEYIAMYVDDFCMIMKDPQSLQDQLMAPPYNFKLKGPTENWYFTLDVDLFVIAMALCVWILERILIEWKNHTFNTSRHNQYSGTDCHCREETTQRLIYLHSLTGMVLNPWAQGCFLKNILTPQKN